MPQPYSVFTGYSPGLIVVPDPASEGEPMEIALENLNRLQSADSYRIVSPIPGLDSELLNADVADTDRAADLCLPPSVTAHTRNLAFSIVDGASSDFEKAARLEAFLLENYTYDLRIPPFTRSGDVVDRFLFENQAGFCSQFATSMAVMAQTVGLPTRVAIGYMPGKYNSLTGVHEVRVQDAHAWVEIKFEQYGWVPFDPTPDAPVLVWLDLQLDAGSLTVDWCPRGFSTPPAWASSPRQLRSYMLGRLARAREISLPKHRLVHHFLALALQMRASGWGAKEFRHVYFSSQGLSDTIENQCFLDVLRLVGHLR